MAITIDDLEVTFPGPNRTRTVVLDLPHLEIQTGARTCLVGGSGSGKTTLLNVIAGIVRPTAGRVRVEDVLVTELDEPARDRYRARSVGYVFQTFNLLQGLTALENIRLAMSFADRRGAAAEQRARALLDRVGLSHRRDARPRTLSVGEQQRVALARAVANEPRVVLADEPTANLDEENGAQVLALLDEVVTECSSTLVIVTHDPSVRARFQDVRILKDLGR